MEKQKSKLNLVNSAELMDMQLPPIRFTVADILPSGLTVFAGAPKVGKSLFILKLCLAVANGENFWCYPTRKGTVLYLALEDSMMRLQKRLCAMTDEGSENLFFCNHAPRLDEGLLDELKLFKQGHPDTALIVIDTFLLVRAPAKNNGQNMYERDYVEMNRFQQFAMENDLSIVATHIDKDHLHNHIVVCSYDLESGLKLHYNQFFLSDLRQKSDEICQAHGLNVLKKYNPNVKSQRLGPKEYRAAMNGNSWKMALRVAIDFCMTRAGSKDEFRSLMKKYGYDMVWTPERKYITYICQTAEGKTYKVRDIKLNDEKYLKENMEYEFRIRSELYGQAQGNEYAAGNTASDAGRNASGTDGAGDSDGSDQRRGMDASERNDTQDGGSVSPAVGAESGCGERGEQVHREDDEGSRGAERGNGEGSAKGDDGSDRTGWESERESFRGYRQKNSSGRGNMVDSSRTHSSPDNIGVALMGARGLGNLTSLFEDGEESEEEKRQREARNAGSAVGVVAGLVTGIAIGLNQNHEPNIENNDDEDEDPQMEITM